MKLSISGWYIEFKGKLLRGNSYGGQAQLPLLRLSYGLVMALFHLLLNLHFSETKAGSLGGLKCTFFSLWMPIN